jgi:predicted TPR repeat methyltransferase
MGRTIPDLPDPNAVSRAIVGWASCNPLLARLLATGVPQSEALAGWGLQLLRENRGSEALAALHGATALSPDNPVLWTNLGIALDRANSTEDAIACLETSVALFRYQPHTWLLLGVVRRKHGDWSGSEAAYRAALEQEPDSAAAWQCLGLLKEERRDFAAAIECFTTCLAHGENGAAVWANLGKLCYQTGRIVQAHESYAAAAEREPGNEHYGQMLRKSRFLRDVVEGLAVEDAIENWRQSAAGAGVDRPTDRVELLETAELLRGFGHRDAAIRVARKRLEIRPESATAEYLLNALVGTPGVDRSPRDYVVETFDAFAEGFDAQLVGVLGYDVPGKLCSEVRAATTPGRFCDVLDAGCGTGLCGPLLRPIAGELIGVDLSPKMLEQAARREVYDGLECEEIVVYLGRSPRRFDVVVAADVVIYFGDLVPLFAAAGGALRAGGLFAFSTERLAQGYRLQASGRFAHAPAYVRSAAGEAFAEELCAETTIRLDASERVGGNLFLFRRR